MTVSLTFSSRGSSRAPLRPTAAPLAAPRRRRARRVSRRRPSRQTAHAHRPAVCICRPGHLASPPRAAESGSAFLGLPFISLYHIRSRISHISSHPDLLASECPGRDQQTGNCISDLLGLLRRPAVQANPSLRWFWPSRPVRLFGVRGRPMPTLIVCGRTWSSPPCPTRSS